MLYKLLYKYLTIQLYCILSLLQASNVDELNFVEGEQLEIIGDGGIDGWIKVSSFTIVTVIIVTVTIVTVTIVTVTIVAVTIVTVTIVTVTIVAVTIALQLEYESNTRQYHSPIESIMSTEQVLIQIGFLLCS